LTLVEIDGREISIGNFPIGIDYQGLDDTARGPEVRAEMDELEDYLEGRQLILGVDRLDYTKGMAERFLAYREALVRFPELRERTVFIQIAVPSRENVPEYELLRERIERLSGQINGELGKPGWTPLQYQYRSVAFEHLVALYRLADVAFVTPVKDGMNLVAKEYCAAQVDLKGVLILSEFAGSAAQLGHRGALLVNPFDVEGMAETLLEALELDREERRERMRRMRRRVKSQDVFWWVQRFLSAAAGQPLESFRGAAEYVPHLEP
jgi:trehalose 6-phosphate synthase